MKRLAIIITHPIQYYVPIFQLLAKVVELKVFYTWGESSVKKYDPGFGKVIEWDIPLLSGYHYSFEKNIAKTPGSHHFNGIRNPELVRNIEDFRPHAVLVFGWSYAAHLKIIRYFKGKIPVWFRGDSNLLDAKPGLKSLLKTILLKWVYQHIDKAFYVGENNKAYFIKHGLKNEQLVYAPHAIDNERFGENTKLESMRLRASLGIRDEDILVLFAGKLEEKKNPGLLLDAFMEVEEMMENKKQDPVIRKDSQQKTAMNEKRTHLLFVGNGELEESLKFKVESLKLKNVHFLDFQNQSFMPVIYQACDLFCLPSQGPGETWGLAVNEAMACGKAVIISDKVGCGQDLVKEGINGYIIPSKDKNYLIQKLDHLLNNSEKLNSMGNSSLQMINSYSHHTISMEISKELAKL